MKRLIVLLCIFAFSASVWALSPQTEAVRLLLQAQAAEKAKDYAQAAESLSKAEKLGVKLPDTFYYHYGLAYVRTGKFEQGREMLERYLDLSGNKGKFYQEALVLLNDIEAAIKKKNAEKEAAIKKQEEERDAARKKYASALKEYESNVEYCPKKFQYELDELEQASLDALAYCKRKWGSACNPESDNDFVSKRKRFLFTRRDGVDAYCNDRYTKPEIPAVLR